MSEGQFVSVAAGPICGHGQLAGSCEVCDLRAQLADAQASIADLRMLLDAKGTLDQSDTTCRLIAEKLELQAELSATRTALAKLVDVYSGHGSECASHRVKVADCGHSHSGNPFEVKCYDPLPCDCGYTDLVDSEVVRRAVQWADAQIAEQGNQPLT